MFVVTVPKWGKCGDYMGVSEAGAAWSGSRFHAVEEHAINASRQKDVRVRMSLAVRSAMQA